MSDKIFIPGNVPSSKNSRQWTGGKLIASKATLSWRKKTKWYWIKERQKWRSLLKEKSCPLRVHFQFVRKSKHRFDYINPAQTIQDEMVKYKWIEDDNCDIIIPVFDPYLYDKTNPGVYIYLE